MPTDAPPDAVALPIRALPPEEWRKLASVFAEAQSPMPDPRMATIFVAEDGGQIVGFLVLQFVPHVEPLWIDPAYRGKVFFPRLLAAAELLLRGGQYFAFAPDDHMAAITTACGLTPLPWRVFTRRVD